MPGHPEQSELIRRIEAEGDEAMPPPSTMLSLVPAERATLRAWIAAAQSIKSIGPLSRRGKHPCRR